MKYDTHIISSLALGASFAVATNTNFSVGFAAGIVLGSLLPDIDEPRSMIGRRSFGVSKAINKIFGHRGFTHSLLALGLLTFFLLQEKDIPIFRGIALGATLHVFEDFFSIRGVPLLYPLTKKKFKPPITYRTGSQGERLLYYISIVLFGYLLFTRGIGSQLWESFKQILSLIEQF